MRVIGGWMFWVLVEPFLDLKRALCERTGVASRALREAVAMKVLDVAMNLGLPDAIVEWLAADRAERAVMRLRRRLTGRLARALGAWRVAKLLGARCPSHEAVLELPVCTRINASGRRVSIACTVQELSERQASLLPEEPRVRVSFSVTNEPADKTMSKGIAYGAILDDPTSALLRYYGEGPTLPGPAAGEARHPLPNVSSVA